MSGSSNFSLGSFGRVSHTCLAAETTGLLATTPTQGLPTGPLLGACPRGQFVLPYRDGLRTRAQRDMTVQTSGGAVLWERHSGGAGDDNIGKAHLALDRRGLLAGTEVGKARTQAPGDPGWGASFPSWQASEVEPGVAPSVQSTTEHMMKLSTGISLPQSPLCSVLPHPRPWGSNNTGAVMSPVLTTCWVPSK